MTLHYFCHLGGLLKLALSSSDDGNHASIRRQCRSGQLHAVSGYVAWPRFGTLRRAIHSVSHAFDLQRWSSYRTIAKTIPKRYPSFTKSSPGDRLGTQKAEQVVDVSAKTMPKHYNFEVSSCEWPKHAESHFLSKRLAAWRDHPSSTKEDQTGTGKSTSAPQQGWGSKWLRFKTMLKQRLKNVKICQNRKPCKTIGDSLTWWRTSA